MKNLGLVLFGICWAFASFEEFVCHDQPLSRIGIHRALVDIKENAYVKASPSILGLKGQNTEWVTLEYSHSNPSVDDWIGVFSPANFSALLITD